MFRHKLDMSETLTKVFLILQHGYKYRHFTVQFLLAGSDCLQECRTREARKQRNPLKDVQNTPASLHDVSLSLILPEQPVSGSPLPHRCHLLFRQQSVLVCSGECCTMHVPPKRPTISKWTNIV